jgi:hypothetical protein
VIQVDISNLPPGETKIMRMSISLMSYSREVHGLDIVFGYNGAEEVMGFPSTLIPSLIPIEHGRHMKEFIIFLKSMLI